MKRFLCIALAATMLLMLLVGALSASAADDRLIVTADGGNTVTVKVGDEFEFVTCLYAGEDFIISAQGEIYYDADLAQPYLYGETTKYGTINHRGYSFPNVSGCSITHNVSTPGTVYYNFSGSDAENLFNDIELIFCRYRFKALAAGEMTIENALLYLENTYDEMIYYGGKVVADCDPYYVNAVISLSEDETDAATDGATDTSTDTASTEPESTDTTSTEPESTDASTAEPESTAEQESTAEPEPTDTSAEPSETATIRPIGDVDLGGDVDINDATYIQRYLAHLQPLSDEQLALGDVDGNGDLEITDATYIQMLLARFIDAFPHTEDADAPLL